MISDRRRPVFGSPRLVGRARPLLAAGLAVGVAAAVWADVGAHGLLARADGPVHDLAVCHRPEWLVGASRALTDTGAWEGRLVVASVVLVPLVLTRRLPLRAVLAPGLAMAAAPAISASLKRIVGRERPSSLDALVVETDASFPSGHAMGTAALAVALAGVMLARGAWRGGDVPAGGRAGVGALALAWPVGVGLTRVELGVHWPTDVLAGWALGVAVGLLALWAAGESRS